MALGHLTLPFKGLLAEEKPAIRWGCYSVPLALVGDASCQQFLQHLLMAALMMTRNWTLNSIHCEQGATGRERGELGDSGQVWPRVLSLEQSAVTRQIRGGAGKPWDRIGSMAGHRDGCSIARARSRGHSLDLNAAHVLGDSHTYWMFSPLCWVWWVCGVLMAPPGSAGMWDAPF